MRTKHFWLCWMMLFWKTILRRWHEMNGDMWVGLWLVEVAEGVGARELLYFDSKWKDKVLEGIWSRRYEVFTWITRKLYWLQNVPKEDYKGWQSSAASQFTSACSIDWVFPKLLPRSLQTWCTPGRVWSCLVFVPRPGAIGVIWIAILDQFRRFLGLPIFFLLRAQKVHSRKNPRADPSDLRYLKMSVLPG